MTIMLLLSLWRFLRGDPAGPPSGEPLTGSEETARAEGNDGEVPAPTAAHVDQAAIEGQPAPPA